MFTYWINKMHISKQIKTAKHRKKHIYIYCFRFWNQIWQYMCCWLGKNLIIVLEYLPIRNDLNFAFIPNIKAEFWALFLFFLKDEIPKTIGASWSWSYGKWIYNCLCNHCISPLKLWVRTPFMSRCTPYNVMW
jgi:hypothetical protein